MAENVLISIITINFNNLAGLKKTIDSVIGQTWKEFEYIVIDGSSTDSSAAYIESQSKHIDFWLCVIRTKGLMIINKNKSNYSIDDIENYVIVKFK